MGHRALVAVERSGGRYDCYRSQWGAAAAFGGARRRLADLDAARENPVVRDAPVRTVLGLLRMRPYETLLVRETDGTGTTYAVYRLTLPGTGGEPSTDARASREPVGLVPVPEGETARRLDCAVRTAKDVLGDAVDAGLLPREAAERYLGGWLARHPDVPDGSLWLGGGLEGR